MTEPARRTHLYQWHVDHGARMVPFAGWEMPVQYPTGPIDEHHTTRRAAGLFDIDHMAQIDVRGPDAEVFVNYLVTYDVRAMATFDAHYALMCYADGGVVDDLFVYKLPDRSDEAGRPYYFLVVNAANREKDVAWVRMHAGIFDVEVRDLSDETYMLAFQGPQAPAILDRLTRVDLTQVGRFTAVTDTIFEDVPVLLGRTGYTGEDGFELFFPAEHALKVWQGILDEGEAEGVKPIGLAARDSLRFEPCMPLYGHELAPDITPVEARLGFALSFGKDFIGRDALLKQKLEGPDYVLVGFEMVDRGVPRHGYQVTYQGLDVGRVTTGMFSPTTERYLGLAYVPREISALDTEIEIVIRDRPKKATIVKRPFYVPVYRR
ncbi:MAG: glycine cleavage system aminomethyltransferase GcvT [Anaerolineae bacterium]